MPVGFQIEAFIRKNRGERFENRTLFGLFRVQTVDSFYPNQAVIFLGVFWRAHLPNDHVAGAHAETPDLRLANINIISARQQMPGTQESDAIIDQFQHAAAKLQAFLFGICAQKAENQLVLFQPAVTRYVHLPGKLAQTL